MSLRRLLEKLPRAIKSIMALEITQFCMQNETNQGHRIKSLVFKQGTEMHNFCLKQQP